MRDRMFEAARWWGISPFDVETLPLSCLIELIEQANRINSEVERNGKRY